MIDIRIASETDLDPTLAVERAAFGGGEDEAALVRNLLADPSAEPRLSLLAWDGHQPVGHILFTAAKLGNATATILAPLAVIPDRQKQGIGGKLIRQGLNMLAEQGVDLVFVLGHIEYYPRHGFEPAGRLGFDAPYPIPEKVADAWMVQALRGGVIGHVTGTVRCAKAMDKKEYWVE